MLLLLLSLFSFGWSKCPLDGIESLEYNACYIFVPWVFCQSAASYSLEIDLIQKYNLDYTMNGSLPSKFVSSVEDTCHQFTAKNKMISSPRLVTRTFNHCWNTLVLNSVSKQKIIVINEAIKLGAYKENGQWKWTDGSSFDYHNFDGIFTFS